jgi:hypothetical protein
VTDAELRKNTPSKKRPLSVVPIPSSIEHIPGYPQKLIIFKVEASSYFWCRCFHDGKHLKRSTKTEYKRKAIEYAKKFFADLVTGQINQICRVTRNSSFVACCEGVIKEDALKVERGEVTKQYSITQKNRIQGLLFEFFGDRDIKDVDYALMDDFRTELFRRGLANSTIKLHFSTLSKVLTYAQRYKLLDVPPVKPQIKQEDNARGFFNIREYLALRRASHRLLGSNHGISQKEDGKKAAGQPLRRISVTEEIMYAIPFMVYTFIRPTDLKTMKHKHIEIRSGARGDYLYMPIPETKKHDKPITSLPRAAYYYKRLRQYQQSRGLGDDDHFVFVPDMENRTYAYRCLTRQFDVLLDAISASITGDGDKTLYSLRHTSIMFRMIYGGEINLLTLARNARTSVAMIERFYASRLEGGMVVDELHRKKN